MESSKVSFFQRSYLKPLFIDLRCPECNKLYRLDTRDILSDFPHFDCLQCKTVFTVQIDPNSPRAIITKSINTHIKYQLTKLDIAKSESIKLCPKCQATNLQKATECIKCGLIFAKWNQSQKEGGVLPSVVKAWEDLINDYNNILKHLAFVGQCEELQAIPFALRKYEELKTLQPADPIANKMHRKLLLKLFAHQNIVQKPWIQKIFTSTFWLKALQILSWILPIGIILIGLLTPTVSNLISFGIAWLFLRAAVFVFWKNKDNFF